MPPVGFEPVISAGELPQTYALDRTPPGTGRPHLLSVTHQKEVVPDHSSQQMTKYWISYYVTLHSYVTNWNIGIKEPQF